MLALFLAMAVAGLMLTGVIRVYAVRREVLDIPGERSSHTVPTPRGGGLSFVLLLPVILLLLPVEGPVGVLWTLGGCTLALAAVGWIDDHRPLTARFRFFAQSLIALAGLLALPQLPSLPLFNYQLSLSTFLLPLLLLALVWLTNLYNFMDGINGLAALEAIFVLLAGALLLVWQGETQWPLLVLLCAPLLGFLYWNFPVARIFMGDVCSAPLGLLLALLAVWLAAESAVNLWCWLILLSVFIVDASWTLAVRMLTGQRWSQPHRSHCYQIFSRRWNSHARVVVAAMSLNVGWLLPWAMAALRFPQWAVLCWLAAVLPLTLICWRCGAGRPEMG